jgi:uncharacterized protein (TIGR02266 family)
LASHLEFTLHVATPEELDSKFYPNGRLGGLAVEGPSPGSLGQQVKLTVVVRQPARRFEVQTQLAWARHKPGPNQPADFGLDFLAEDEGVRTRLLAFARQQLASGATRADFRHSVELEIRLVHEGEQRRELIADISRGGAFVSTENPLPVGAAVQFFLRPPRAFVSLELFATVVWVRTAGAHPGMGLQFETTRASREKLEKLILKLTR